MASGDSTDPLCFIECRPNDDRDCDLTLCFFSYDDFRVAVSLCVSDSEACGGDWSESDVLSSIAVVLTAGGATSMISVRGDFFFSGGFWFSVIRTDFVGVFGDFGGSLVEVCTLGAAT